MGSKLAKKSGVKPKRAVPASDRKVVEKKATKEVELVLPSDSDSDSDDEEFEDAQDGEESSDEDEEEEEEEEQLGGFESTDDEGESDDESPEEPEEQAQEPKKTQKAETHEVKQLPAKQTKASKKQQKVSKGVIYIGRLPEGFEEEELTKYFNQFGDITNVKLPRNKKSGRSKHYAFVEFANADDAKVAQETMNNYLLLNHQLKVNVVDEEFKSSKKFKKAFFKVSKPKKDVKTLNENSKKKSQERAKALKAAGIDF